MKRFGVLLVAMVCAVSPGSAADLVDGVLTAGQPVLLEADRIDYASDKESLVAEGDVELSQSGRRLLADRIEYDIAGRRVMAEGNIVLINPDGSSVFAEEMTIDDDLENGFLVDVGVLLADRSRLAATAGRRVGGERIELDRVVYSPCRICADDDDPLWQIKADRVVHDQESRTVAYRNARFEILGVPVAWLPYFFHADPTVERKTGFLTPRLGTDTELGLTAETPFFIDIAPDRDLTLLPLVTSSEGALLGAEYRQLHTFGETTLGGSITRTSDAEPDADGDTRQVWRGHVEGEGRYNLDENRPFGFDLALASDDTYLERYDFSSEDVLENRAFIEEYTGADLFSLDIYGFQGLREDDDQGLIPVVAPWVRSHKTSGRGAGGSFFFADSSILALTRTQGLDTRRVSGEVGWQLPHVGAFGELMTFETSLRGDLYSVSGEAGDRASSSGREAVGRLVPRATFDLSWPLVGNAHGWSQVVEPIVSASWIGNDANKREIPNEDSLVFEFDETNLFEPDRFTGLDKVESGAKVTYGLRFDSIGPSGLRVGGVVGQSLREGADQLFARGSGLEESLSDYVGRFDFRPGPNFDLSYRFRLAKDELTFRRSDLSLRFGPPRMRFNLQYLQLSEDLPDTGLNERQEIVAGVRLQMTNSLAVATQFRRDLTLDRPVTNTYGILFSDDCLSIRAGLEQNFTEKGELEDETRFSVRVTLRSLGDLEADSTLF